MINASVRVEGKSLEFFEGEGGAFPFKVVESNRRRSFIKLTIQDIDGWPLKWSASGLLRVNLSG